jgi:hypothetical protein
LQEKAKKAQEAQKQDKAMKEKEDEQKAKEKREKEASEYDSQATTDSPTREVQILTDLARLTRAHRS